MWFTNLFKVCILNRNMPYKDVEKRREFRRKWYQKNKDSERRRTIEHRARIKAWYFNYKKKLKCDRCPEKHPACLEFHHKESNKENEISIMATHGYSIKKILEEISKCVVLCSNCHRKEHNKTR